VNLRETGTYAAFEGNDRTGWHRFAIVSGAQARAMLANSVAPKRLRFVPYFGPIR
jgi:hypothetical protein